jgi:hypothetical protein
VGLANVSHRGEVKVCCRSQFDYFGHFLVPPLFPVMNHFYRVPNGHANFRRIDGFHG